jgi:hypothetical protein
MPVTTTARRLRPCIEWYNRFSDCQSSETYPKNIPYAGMIDRRSGVLGYYFYYSDYYPLSKKGYYPQKWPYRSGTLLQEVVDYLLGIFFIGRSESI